MMSADSGKDAASGIGGEDRKKKKNPPQRLLRLQDYQMNFDLMPKDALNSFQDDIIEFFGIKGRMLSMPPISVETARAEVAHVVGDLGFAIAVPDPNQPDHAKSSELPDGDSSEDRDPASALDRKYEFGLLSEFEAEISKDDLRRFCMYTSVLSDRYRLRFLDIHNHDVAI
jgi:hypothetical protein